jgi:pyruvate dehydrogenase E1 component alpha subunit
MCKQVLIQQSSHRATILSGLSTNFSSRLRKIVPSSAYSGSDEEASRFVCITIDTGPSCMPANWKAEALSCPPSTLENSLITPDKLKQLYAMMIRLRMIDERLRRKTAARSQRVHFYEACEVACTVDLRKEDVIATLPDQYVAYVSRGVTPADYLRRGIQGRHSFRSNFSREFAISLNVLDVQNGHLSLATGAAFGCKAQQSGSVVVTFCRPQEVVRFQDCIYFATQHRLPIIYVQLGDSPLKSRKHKQLSYPSFTAIPVEQNDVVALYRVASEAIDKARRGVGPTLIQCVDFLSSTRNGFAAESGDPMGYMEQYLRKKNLWSTDLKKTIHESFSRELNEALQSPGSSRR